jgi:DNA adenine methylase Dam
MYIDSVMNYTGSKFKLLNQILPEFDLTKKNFVDVFCGGGSVYTNVVDKYDKIIINDIINDLIGIHKGLMYSDDIIESTKLLCPGKLNPEGYSKLREDYNLNPSPDKLWALMLSCTNNMVRFNQKFKFNQTYGNRGYNDNTDKKVKIFTDHIRRYVDKIEFYSRPFYELDVKPNTMYYLDPPYSNTNAGYNSYWKNDDDEKLYKYIKNIDRIGSSFMLSGVLEHDDKPCKLLDKLIMDEYKVIELHFNYNKVSRKGKKDTREIIIVNY